MSRYEEDDDIRTALLNMYGLGRQMTPRPKKEMTTRELLEQQLAGYDDDMEPRTPMPDPELEFDGNELYVKRNNVRQASWPAMAGQPRIPKQSKHFRFRSRTDSGRTLLRKPR